MGTVRRLAQAADRIASLLRLQYLTLVRVEYCTITRAANYRLTGIP